MNINAVILAGGLARRMNGEDKGLQCFQGKPLVQWVIERLTPQVAQISINANRNQMRYAQWGLPVFADDLPNFQGPLSGMLTALQQSKSEMTLFVPCDSPVFPLNLVAKLQQNTAKNGAFAADFTRDHPTFCLLSKQLIPALSTYLAQGERRLLQFMQQQQLARVAFSSTEGEFVNFNCLADLQAD